MSPANTLDFNNSSLTSSSSYSMFSTHIYPNQKSELFTDKATQ